MSQNARSFFCWNQRFGFVLAFGFSSGLPFALCSSTLQAWLTEAGVGLMAIAWLSLVSFPYNFKFLWAPFVDRFLVGHQGRRRGWILLMQGALVFILMALSFLNPLISLKTLGALVLLLAFCSATQDVAIDAYRAETLLPEERGLGSACFILAYRMALLTSGGLALVIANYWGFARAYQLMALVLLLSMIVTLKMPEKAGFDWPQTPQSWREKVDFFLEPFLNLWHREQIVWILAFVFLYKAGAALAVALLTNFLLHGLGFSLIEVGLSSKVAIISGTVLGAFVGGAMLYRLGIYTALLAFGVAQAFSILLFLVLAFFGKKLSLMVLCLFVENVCSGMSTAALMAFLMSLCQARYAATQFALLSSLDTLTRLFAGPLAAMWVLHFGWLSFYGFAFIASLPALFILAPLAKHFRQEAGALVYA